MVQPKHVKRLEAILDHITIRFRPTVFTDKNAQILTLVLLIFSVCAFILTKFIQVILYIKVGN